MHRIGRGDNAELRRPAESALPTSGSRDYQRAMSSPESAPRSDKKTLEEGLAFAPKFDRDGLIPAVAMDATTKEPLMLAYMNAESLRLTLEKGEAVYWSRSRRELWHKGATSGHVQKVREIRTDCDQDALILYVDQIGAGACHTGRGSCFYRSIKPGEASLSFNQEDRSFDPEAVYGKR